MFNPDQHIKNAQLTFAKITLDECIYENVQFQNFLLIYEGSDHVGLQGCGFSGCTFHFLGPAAATIEFLRVMYQNPGTRVMAEAYIQAIQGKPATAQPTESEEVSIQ